MSLNRRRLRCLLLAAVLRGRAHRVLLRRRRRLDDLGNAVVRDVGDLLVAAGAVVVDVLAPVQDAGQAGGADAQAAESNAGKTAEGSIGVSRAGTWHGKANGQRLWGGAYMVMLESLSTMRVCVRWLQNGQSMMAGKAPRPFNGAGWTIWWTT